jgi:hypothetical protein
LALALGCTVRDLLGRITARELAEWSEYYKLEPWGNGCGATAPMARSNRTGRNQPGTVTASTPSEMIDFFMAL